MLVGSAVADAHGLAVCVAGPAFNVVLGGGMAAVEGEQHGELGAVEAACMQQPFPKPAALRLVSRQRNVGSSLLAELQGSEVPANAVFNGLKFIVSFGFRDTAAGDDHDLVHVPHMASRRAIINDVRPRIRVSGGS